MMEQMMQEDTEESVKVLQEQTLQAVNRLLEDIHNVELQHPLSFANSRSIEFSGEMVPGYELGMADFSSMVFKNWQLCNVRQCNWQHLSRYWYACWLCGWCVAWHNNDYCGYFFTSKASKKSAKHKEKNTQQAGGSAG
ncbi:hypothetical protein ABR759_00490 [Escherichia coli]